MERERERQRERERERGREREREREKTTYMYLLFEHLLGGLEGLTKCQTVLSDRTSTFFC